MLRHNATQFETFMRQCYVPALAVPFAQFRDQSAVGFLHQSFPVKAQGSVRHERFYRCSELQIRPSSRSGVLAWPIRELWLKLVASASHSPAAIIAFSVRILAAHHLRRLQTCMMLYRSIVVTYRTCYYFFS